MKKYLILLLFLPVFINAQVVDYALTGQYTIKTFSTTTEVTKLTRPQKTSSKWGTIVVDTVFYVNAESGLDTLTNFTRPAKKKAAILFERGGSWNGTITVPSDSIVYCSWGTGSAPVISGFTTVTGWTDEGGGIYSKVLSVESNPEIVTINGVQYAMGRTPNADRYNPQYSDYYHIDSYSSTTSITDSECNSATTDWDGAEIVIRSSNYWDWIRTTITTHSGTTLTFTNSDALANGFGYFIQDDLRTLDQFGEWYYGGGKFYMYFGAANPTSYIVKVSAKDKLIDVNTRDYITVRNINLQGANSAAITTNASASNAYNLTINSCSLDYNYTSIYGHQAPNLTVTNCNILRSSNRGIYNHWNSDGMYIANNTIDSTGLVIGAFSGQLSAGSCVALMATYSKLLLSSNKSIIENNDILNSGQSGIYFSGDSMIVRGNYVDNYAITASDAGGIYHGNQAIHSNMVINDNIVVDGIISNDTKGLPTGATNASQYNIYMDYYSHLFEVKRNVVANTHGGGIMVHGAQNIVLEDNIIYNANDGVKFQEIDGSPSPLRDIVMKHNTIVTDNDNQDYIIWARSEADDFDEFGVIDSNYYSSNITNQTPFATLVNVWVETNRTLASWRSATNQDAKSPLTFNTGSNTIFDYNAGTTAKTVNITGSYIKADSTEVTGSYTLQPQTGIVLIKDTVTSINIDSMYAYYPLNGNLADTLGIGPTGTNNGAQVVAGKFQYAYDFNNTSDNIYFPINTDEFNTTGRYSVSMWIKVDVLPSTAGRNYHLFYDILSGPSYKVWVYITSANTIQVTTRNTVPSTFSSTSVAGAISSTGTWYHVIVNIPIVGEAAQVYINGERSLGTTNTALSGTARTSNYRFYLGDYLASPVNTTDGQIDAVKIRNKWYTAEEAEWEYNSGDGR